MEALPYLLKVNICWIVFYGCYWALFRKNTFFKLNRSYLLFTLLISFVIPTVELRETVTVISNNVSVGLPREEEGMVSQVGPENSVSFELVMTSLYLIGSGIMLLNLVLALLKIRKLVRAGTSEKRTGYQLVVSHRQHVRTGSFSFLQWLIISSEDYQHNSELIVAHELVHIRQWHTLDILLIEVLKIFFWFNPALWFYKQALQNTHEFLADEQALDRDRYASFLVSYTRNALITSVANQFFDSSLLKKRIYMIYQDRSAAWVKCKYLFLFPILAAMVALMASRKYDYERRTELAKAAVDTELVTVKGLVTDEAGDPIANAAITFSDSYQNTVTSETGRFEIGNIPTGIQMTVFHRDFVPQIRRIGRKTDEYHIRLKSSNPSGLATLKKRQRNIAASQVSTVDKSIRLDRWPMFPEGRNRFIANNLIYPQQALKDGVEGQVSVSFLIDVDGRLSDMKIEKGVRQDIDNEALRVVSSMPNWIPAKKNGEAIEVRYTMSIAFNIEVYQLPLSVKEKTPPFLGHKVTYIPPPMQPVTKAHLKRFFEGSEDVFQDSTPPVTKLLRYGYGIPPAVYGKRLDIRIKLPKK
jgi:TonB family protein